MQSFPLAAGLLAILVGTVHSVLGEHLIFRRMRNGGVIPTTGEPLLRERHVRILWAGWHVVTVFGWALGAMLLRMSVPSSDVAFESFVRHAIAISMLASALLVLVATRGRHPGWLGLLLVAILAWLA